MALNFHDMIQMLKKAHPESGSKAILGKFAYQAHTNFLQRLGNENPTIMKLLQVRSEVLEKYPKSGGMFVSAMSSWRKKSDESTAVLNYFNTGFPFDLALTSACRIYKYEPSWVGSMPLQIINALLGRIPLEPMKAILIRLPNPNAPGNDKAFNWLGNWGMNDLFQFGPKNDNLKSLGRSSTMTKILSESLINAGLPAQNSGDFMANLNRF